MSSRYAQDYVEESRLGKGGFGEVVKARKMIDGRLYAIKKITQRSQETLSEILKEVRLLSQMNHPSVVRYYNTWLEEIPGYAESETDTSTERGTEDSRGTLLQDVNIEFAESKSRGLDFMSSSGHPDIEFGYESGEGDDDDDDDEWESIAPTEADDEFVVLPFSSATAVVGAAPVRIDMILGRFADRFFSTNRPLAPLPRRLPSTTELRAQLEADATGLVSVDEVLAYSHLSDTDEDMSDTDEVALTGMLAAVGARAAARVLQVLARFFVLPSGELRPLWARIVGLRKEFYFRAGRRVCVAAAGGSGPACCVLKGDFDEVMNAGAVAVDADAVEVRARSGERAGAQQRWDEWEHLVAGLVEGAVGGNAN